MTAPGRAYAPTEASLTWPELLAARAIQQELGAVKRCSCCGLVLPVAAYPAYGSAACTECAVGVERWSA